MHTYILYIYIYIIDSQITSPFSHISLALRLELLGAPFLLLEGPASGMPPTDSQGAGPASALADFSKDTQVVFVAKCRDSSSKMDVTHMESHVI